MLLPTVTRALMVGARVSMLMVFAPFFGNTAISARVKVGMTVALTVLLYPAGAAAAEAGLASDWLKVLVGELAVGLLMGLTMQCVMEGALVAGQIMGFQMGLSLETAIDPMTQADSPVIAAFGQVVVLLIFLQLDVHLWILKGLAKSFEYVPPGTISLNAATADELLRVAGGMFLVGLQIAAPALMATFLSDLALGFIGRATPQLPVMLTGISVKNLLGTLVLWGCVAFWPRVFESHFSSALATTERLLRLAR